MPEHISDEAKSAIRGALNILNRFSDELPASIFESLNQQLRGNGADNDSTRGSVHREEDRRKRKMNKEIIVEFISKQEEQRLVTGIVLQPSVVDAHNDIVKAETIEKAAHDFMVNSRTIGKQHKGIAENVKVVESFIAPVDMTINKQEVLKGSWIMTVKVMNDELWSAIKKNELNAFSIGGFGEKVPVNETA